MPDVYRNGEKKTNGLTHVVNILYYYNNKRISLAT